jgi:uncharacterized protein YjbJ (UPF0337 family)
MNKDQVEGKIKDVAGRVERQAGEWTGSKEAEARGAAKQVEGKAQNAWGDVKDAGQKRPTRLKQISRAMKPSRPKGKRIFVRSAKPARCTFAGCGNRFLR